jgi:hypothetical protein
LFNTFVCGVIGLSALCQDEPTGLNSNYRSGRPYEKEQAHSQENKAHAKSAISSDII